MVVVEPKVNEKGFMGAPIFVAVVVSPSSPCCCFAAVLEDAELPSPVALGASATGALGAPTPPPPPNETVNLAAPASGRIELLPPKTAGKRSDEDGGCAAAAVAAAADDDDDDDEGRGREAAFPLASRLLLKNDGIEAMLLLLLLLLIVAAVAEATAGIEVADAADGDRVTFLTLARFLGKVENSGRVCVEAVLYRTVLGGARSAPKPPFITALAPPRIRLIPDPRRPPV